jgi:hypothetical protein
MRSKTRRTRSVGAPLDLMRIPGSPRKTGYQLTFSLLLPKCLDSTVQWTKSSRLKLVSRAYLFSYRVARWWSMNQADDCWCWMGRFLLQWGAASSEIACTEEICFPGVRDQRVIYIETFPYSAIKFQEENTSSITHYINIWWSSSNRLQELVDITTTSIASGKQKKKCFATHSSFTPCCSPPK